jgi:hypothetical protein
VSLTASQDVLEGRESFALAGNLITIAQTCSLLHTVCWEFKLRVTVCRICCCCQQHKKSTLKMEAWFFVHQPKPHSIKSETVIVIRYSAVGVSSIITELCGCCILLYVISVLHPSLNLLSVSFFFFFFFLFCKIHMSLYSSSTSFFLFVHFL